jgi:hypothetical protein
MTMSREMIRSTRINLGKLAAVDAAIHFAMGLEE